jgi:hypothetical protein
MNGHARPVHPLVIACSVNLPTDGKGSRVVVSIRPLPMRGLPVLRLAAPAILIAAGLSVGTSQGPARGTTSLVADQHPMAGPTTMMPFAASPRSYPFQVRTIVVPHSQPPPNAPALPDVDLPSGLDVPAAAIPRRVLAAYVNATSLTDTADPACRLRWQDLAGIGLVESDNALAGGSSNPLWNGVAQPPILGPRVKGKRRAIGPMQILPSTWAVFAADGNHDGMRDPQDIDDASLAAGDYLCTISPHLDRPRHLIRALYGYNHSYLYVKAVLTAIAGYLDVNPATLGINGLPRPHRHAREVRLGTPPTALTATPTPSPPIPRPTQLWTPPPTPTATPTPPAVPRR